jgi:hypothetical protein
VRIAADWQETEQRSRRIHGGTFVVSVNRHIQLVVHAARRPLVYGIARCNEKSFAASWRKMNLRRTADEKHLKMGTVWIGRR